MMHGEIVRAIKTVLQERGPMTYSAIAREINMPRESVRKACGRLAAVARKDRVVYVKTWVTEVDNERAYPRPVYAYGNNNPNTKRPGAKPRKDVVREYRQRVQRAAGVNAFGPLHSQREASAIRRSSI